MFPIVHTVTSEAWAFCAALRPHQDHLVAIGMVGAILRRRVDKAQR